MSRYLFAFLFLPALGMAQVADYVINTVIGSSTATVLGDAGPANAAELSNPIGMYFDASHNMFIADSGFNRVREVTGGTSMGPGPPTGWVGGIADPRLTRKVKCVAEG